MPGPYYVDPAAVGGGTGADWANAFSTLNAATDVVAAGETIWCKGTEALGAVCNIDAVNNGTSASPIRIIGVNSGTTAEPPLAADRGTDRFCLDAASSYANCISISAGSGKFWIFENLEFKNAISHGMALGNAVVGPREWINCYSHDNGGAGFDIYYNSSGAFDNFYGCRASNNADAGFYYPYYGAIFAFCQANGNTGDGFMGGNSGPVVCYGCLSYDNGGAGVDTQLSLGTILNTVCDENVGDGVDSGSSGQCIIIGCRLTGNGFGAPTAYGINETNTGWVMYGWNFINGNDGATLGDCHAIPYRSDIDTNETSGTEGYVDGAARDYNLTAAATLRSVALPLG